MPRKYDQDGQVPPAHHGLTDYRFRRAAQDLGQGERGTALPVRVERCVLFVFQPLSLSWLRYEETIADWCGQWVVVKAHVGRWSEDCPEHQGCVVYNMADVPLGFGVVSLHCVGVALRVCG